MNESTKVIQEMIEKANHIVVIQADNPDGDSLGSALALESLLEEQGKKVSLYCGVDVPGYLKYIPGHDRVVGNLPRSYDLSILVDCSTLKLLDKLQKSGDISILKSKPLLVIDHHPVDETIPFDHHEHIDESAVATTEIIFQLASEFGWEIDQMTATCLTAGLMADSLGLTTDKTTSRSVRTLASLMDAGANLAKIDNDRRALSAKPTEIISYKGKLLQRIEYFADGRLALLDIPWSEIEKYSPIYNPAVLALEELRLAEGVELSVILKLYPDGKITGKLRSSHGSNIAGDLAAHFGGGGHPAAAGFKVYDWSLDDIKREIVTRTLQLLTKD